jgi:hypothetical protein
MKAVWKALNEIPWDTLLGVGRVYGGGLHKMEPGELARVSAVALWETVAGTSAPSPTLKPEQLALVW